VVTGAKQFKGFHKVDVTAVVTHNIK